MQQTGTQQPTVQLRTAQFRRYAKAVHGLSTDSEIAERTGLTRTTVFRLMKGRIAPGERVIATLLASFPDRHFEDIFEIAYEDAA
jgi:transcriptional regulator with XRE-family HTH domain